MITLKVNYKNLKQRTTLVLTLHYKGNRAINIYRGSFPWDGVDQIALTALPVIGNRTDECLEQWGIMNDGVVGDMTIKPNEVFSGEIDLTRQFKNLNQILKKRDIILFWNYELAPTTAKALPRVGGWRLIPRW